MKIVCSGCGLQAAASTAREREDRAGDDGGRHAADPRHDDVLEQRRAPSRSGAREADGEDRDRDRRLHDLADLEPEYAEATVKITQKRSPQPDRDAGRFRELRAGGRDDRLCSTSPGFSGS